MNFHSYLFLLVRSSMSDNLSAINRLATLHIPSVAVCTPSDDSNRSPSFISTVSRQVLPSDSHLTMTNIFRTSKTTDNMSRVLNNGDLSELKSSSLTRSQPNINENSFDDSSFTNPTEQTPLFERRMKSKTQKTSLDNGKPIRLNRQGLHLPLDTDSLPRCHSYTDDIPTSSNSQERDSNNHVMTSLQPYNSDTTSLRSVDSTASSLSVYLSNQQQTTNQSTNGNTKNELNKSQESIFSFPSPMQKQRSIKSLIMAAATKDKATKQDNDVLLLIASWVLRSPEDFQGRRIVFLFRYIKILFFF